MAFENLKFVRHKHKVKLPFRILSGVIAVLSIPVFAMILIFERPLPWEGVLSLSCCILIFLPVAITSRAPKWFEYLNQKF